MTVTASTAKYVYTGDGVSTVFPFPSLFLASNDILVGVNGVQQVAGYTVAGAGNPSGGTVTFAVAPANGTTVILLRKPTFQQLVDFVNGQTVLGGTVETAFDRLTMMAQYLLDALTRSLRVGDLDTVTNTEDLLLPSALTRANKLFGFDSAGRPVAASPSGTIAPGSIENTDLADMPEATVSGRPVGTGTGSRQNLTSTQLRAIVDDNGIISEKAKSRNEQTNPTVQGWNISFNLFGQTSPNYYNGVAHSYTLTSATPWATNGWLLNLIVENSYNKDIVGNVTTAPVAVAQNVGLQVKKVNGGNDFWAILGVLDVQTPGTNGTGGQALAGIVRGNWQSLNVLADGVRAQAENYSGRPHAGFITGSSQTDGLGAPFDNAWYTGFHCLHAKEFGFRVGGPQGGVNAIIPAKPYVLQTADGSQDVWRISYSGGAEASMRMQGSFELASAALPNFQMQNSSAGLNAKNWQSIVEVDGSLTIRTLNDAQNSASNAVKLTRSGQTPAAIEFPIAGTTAAAANAVLDSGSSNRLLRSTSSARYKTNIEPLDDAFASKVLDLEPVWYRSKAVADPAEWSYYGLIAEQVAEVDPRLVFWGYQEDQYEDIEVAPAQYERRVKEGEQKRPDGVQYERLSVLLLHVAKQQQQTIAALEDRLARVERKLGL